MSNNISANGQEAAFVDRRAHKPARILDTGVVHGEDWSYGLPGLYFPEGRWREVKSFLEHHNAWCRNTDSTKDRIQKNILVAVRCVRFYLRLGQWNGWLYAAARDLSWEYEKLYIAFYTVMAARDAYRTEVVPHITDYQPNAREAAILAEIDAWKEEEWEHKATIDDKDIHGLYKAKIWAARSLVVNLVADGVKVKNLVQSYPINSCLTGEDCGWPCHMSLPVDDFDINNHTIPHLEVDEMGQRFKNLDLQYYVGPDCKLYGVDLFGVFYDLDDLMSHGDRYYGFNPVGVVEKPDGETDEDTDEEDEGEVHVYEVEEEVEEEEDEEDDEEAALNAHLETNSGEGNAVDIPHGDSIDIMQQDDIPSVDECNPRAQGHSDRRLRSRTRSRSPRATTNASRRVRSPLTVALRPGRG